MRRQLYLEDEAAAYAKLEEVVWPKGAVCPTCGQKRWVTRSSGHEVGPALRYCSHCNQHFHAAIGTLFEDKYVPLHKWFRACLLRANFGLQVYSDDLHLIVGVSYGTARRMARQLDQIFQNDAARHQNIKHILRRMLKMELKDPCFSQEAAITKLEEILWPHGPVCPHCGEREQIGRVIGKSARMGLKFCRRCRRQFRATVGTIFEHSHVPLHKWFQAILLFNTVLGGMDSGQLCQALGITRVTALRMIGKLKKTGILDRIGPQSLDNLIRTVVSPGCVRAADPLSPQ